MAAVVAGLWIGLAPLSDNSYFTHLAGGRLVLAEGIPRSDPWSFTAPGVAWVMQSWLAAAVYAVADSVAGGYGMVALQGAVGAGLALVVTRLVSPARSLVPRLALVAVAIGVGAGAWHERPFTIGLLLLGVTLLVAEGRVGVGWLVPAFAVWVNVHGSFPLGLVALAVLAVGAAIDRRQGQAEDGLSAALLVRALGLAAVGTVLGAAGPLGPRLLLFPFELLGQSEVLAAVDEWQAPSFVDLWQRLWLVQLAVAVLLMVRRPRWRSGLVLVVFAVASLLASRNVVVASLVLLPAMARAADGLGTLTVAGRSRLARLAAALLVVLGGLAVAGAVRRPAYDYDGYPVRQVASLRRGGGPLPGEGVATPDFVGNWLEASLGRRASVFYDDRFDMYPADVSADYLVLAAGRPGWEAVLTRHGVDTVVWRIDTPMAALVAASPAWRVVAADAAWVTAERR